MKSTRTINQIIIHCAYTPPSMDVGAAEIRRWHTDPPPKGNGWNDIGYHYVIRRNGSIEKGRDESVVGAHASGHNSRSIGVCLVGGKGANGGSDCNFTVNQWSALESVVSDLVARYPGAKVIGHRDVSAKDCPSFDAQAWWAGR